MIGTMRMTLAAALTVAAVTLPAAAQPGMMGGGMMGSGMMMGPGPGGPQGYGGMCDPRAAGLAEWRIEQIERAIKLTDAQKTALQNLQAASARAADIVRGACPDKFPATSSERLALMEKRMEVMLQAIKVVRPEFDAFYGSLDTEQKKRLDASGPRHWGWRNWRSN